MVEAGGGLRAYQVAGADVVDGYAEEELCPAGRGQILAPWPNRIRDGRYDFSGSTPVGTDGTHYAQRHPRSRALGTLAVRGGSCR